MDHIQFIDAPTDLPSDERNQQRKGVPVALLRASGQIPLIDQVFEKESADPGTERLLSVMAHLPEDVFGEAFAGLVQQVRSHREVELGAGDVNVAQIG